MKTRYLVQWQKRCGLDLENHKLLTIEMLKYSPDKYSVIYCFTVV